MPKPTLFYWLRDQVDTRDRSEGCWEWPYSRDTDGYGLVWSPHLKASVHVSNMALRFAGIWKPPYPKDCALHSCDNPPCFNPAHLRWGTKKDNALDFVARGHDNRPRGTNSVISKLTEDIVRTIRQSTEPPIVLARLYDVHPNTIRSVRAGRNWKHVT